MNKHKSNKIKENSNTVRHLIMGQITTTQNLVAIKEVRHAGQWGSPTISMLPCHFRQFQQSSLQYDASLRLNLMKRMCWTAKNQCWSARNNPESPIKCSGYCDVYILSVQSKTNKKGKLYRGIIDFYWISPQIKLNFSIQPIHPIDLFCLQAITSVPKNHVPFGVCCHATTQLWENLLFLNHYPPSKCWQKKEK